MTKKAIIFICIIFFLSLLFAQQFNGKAKGNTFNDSVRKSKRLLYRKVHTLKNLQFTFFCNCSYKRKRIDLDSCGFKPKKSLRRAKRVAWEHIVPVHVLGESFEAWEKGDLKKCGKDSNGKLIKGRTCVRKFDAYLYMEADMYNIVPSISEIGFFRAYYPMGIIDNEVREFGSCDIEIVNKVIEPRPEIRGDIARIYKYMHHAYPGRNIIPPDQHKMFEKWNKNDPVTIEECKRSLRIEKIQKNRNPFVIIPCKKNFPQLF